MATVKVFSTPTCPYCVKAKEYLNQKGISYENFDVSSDKAKLDEMIKLSGQMGVPVIVVDSEVVVGFDRDRLEKLLVS
ncbi:Uxx-star family glutaredoxin-like (seleno)protein [Candidatus Omnitrophota bacterium]